MALVNSNYRESTLTQSWYDSTFRSLYDLELKPQTLGKIIQRYGEGLSVTNFLNMAGQVMPVKSNTITIFEQGAPTRPVTCSIGTSADASAGVTVTFSATDDSDDYVRAGFDLIVPKSYTNKDYDVPLRLTVSSSTWTGTPYENDVQITTALSDVICFLGASSWGYGTNQPEPMASGMYSRTTNTRILKDTAGVEGGIVFQESWEEVELSNGKKGIWTRSLGEMDFRLDDQIDSFLLTGIANGNKTNLTAASVSGNTAAIPSADGLVKTMKSLSQEQTWSTAYDIDKFRAIKVLLENVGIVNKNVDFFVGTDLNASIEASMIDWLKATSAGHNFYMELNSVGFNVREVQINGVKFYINELSSFSNPNKFGLDAYGYRDMGFLLPQGEYKATLEGAGMKENFRLPHLTLGYPQNNGEDRKRIFKIEPGMNGFAGMGDVVANGYDGVKFYTLAHVMPIFTHLHKAILVEKDANEGGGA